MRLFTFSFDDGYQSWVDAAKILTEHEYNGTFNVVLRNVVYKRVDTRPRMFPTKNVITWDELEHIQRLGHEIASHGTRHIDLPHCNKMEQWMEIVASRKVFRSKGFNVSTYGCAFNSLDGAAVEVALKNYDSFRSSVGMNHYPPTKRMYHAMDGTKAVQYAEMSFIDDVWIVGIWHDVDPVKFRAVVEKVKTLDVVVKSVREVYA